MHLNLFTAVFPSAYSRVAVMASCVPKCCMCPRKRPYRAQVQKSRSALLPIPSCLQAPTPKARKQINLLGQEFVRISAIMTTETELRIRQGKSNSHLPNRGLERIIIPHQTYLDKECSCNRQTSISNPTNGLQVSPGLLRQSRSRWRGSSSQFPCRRRDRTI